LGVDFTVLKEFIEDFMKHCIKDYMKYWVVFALAISLWACSDSPTETSTFASDESSGLLSSGVESSFSNSLSETGLSSSENLSSANVSSSAGASLSEEIVTSSGEISSAASSTVTISSAYSSSSSIQHQMKLIPAGSFHYGKVENSYFTTPSLGVLTDIEAFYMDSTEFTQKEFTELMGFNPSVGLVCDNCPVTDVSFYDGILAANARSIRDGLDTIYEYKSLSLNSEGNVTVFNDLERFDSRNGYRIANADEFKYALRGGTETDFPLGSLADTTLGTQYVFLNNDNNVFPSYSRPQAVAAKLPNQYGLYDMIGNAGEDAWSNSTSTSSAKRVGEDFSSSGWPKFLYSASISSVSPSAVGAFSSFRFVRNYP
jgi:formylglycine-generating enzyme required for sulfatase activity